jgi:hypothetical protein
MPFQNTEQMQTFLAQAYQALPAITAPLVTNTALGILTIINTVIANAVKQSRMFCRQIVVMRVLNLNVDIQYPV